MGTNKKVICAGHICLDITPVIPDGGMRQIEKVLQPGKLLNVGETEISLGGAVSNTGLAMKFFGADVELMGKIGRDAFGDMIYREYEKFEAQKGLIRDEDGSTSYSIVLASPGIDRVFLHHTGANDTYCEKDIPWEKVKDAAMFHFGYPPSDAFDVCRRRFRTYRH